MDEIITLNGKDYLITNKVTLNNKYYLYVTALNGDGTFTILEEVQGNEKHVFSITDQNIINEIFKIIDKENRINEIS